MHACSFQWQLSSPPSQAHRRLTGLREENKDKRNERRTPEPWHRAFFFSFLFLTLCHAIRKENMPKEGTAYQLHIRVVIELEAVAC